VLEILSDYGLFLAKTLTFVIAVVVVVAAMASIGARSRRQARGHLEVEALHSEIQAMRESLQDNLLSARERKALVKARHKEKKIEAKRKDAAKKHRIFVLNFKGDIRASAVAGLREEITALLGQATNSDEVVVRLESPGGMVHSYGLAASQLDRIRKQGIPLTICVDKVAASGGYMMACVADRILAAPFAIIGSIGVVAQIPNFHRLLKKHDVDFELLTAGEHKRTLTIFGENTDSGREKFLEDLQETHEHFKDFIRQHRSGVDVDSVATGEIWLGTRALELGLVDEVMTSDEYLTAKLDETEIFELSYARKKSLPQKMGLAAEESADNLLVRWFDRLSGCRYFS